MNTSDDTTFESCRCRLCTKSTRRRNPARTTTESWQKLALHKSTERLTLQRDSETEKSVEADCMMMTMMSILRLCESVVRCYSHWSSELHIYDKLSTSAPVNTHAHTHTWWLSYELYAHVAEKTSDDYKKLC